ncbi:hypothetical protein ILUMI_05005, partial [Ignelater luminosus]
MMSGYREDGHQIERRKQKTIKAYKVKEKKTARMYQERREELKSKQYLEDCDIESHWEELKEIILRTVAK